MNVLPSFSHFLFFMMATLLLNITPGSDVMYIASQTLASKRQGILATLGTSTGVAIWIVATVVGLAALLRQSHIAFDCIKWGGAAYLLYLAYKALTQKTHALDIIKTQNRQGYKAYYQGIFTNLANPKVGLFFVTFLPQFVESGHGAAWAQLLFLGAYFITSGTFVNLIYVFLFAKLRERLFEQLSVQKWLNRFTALVFGLIAIRVITAKV